MSNEPSSLAIALAVAWTLIQLFGCSGAPAAPPEVARAELCIRGAKVFDGERDRGVLDMQVRAGRIAAVGPGLCTAGGDGVVDAAGHTLLPGLIDAHSHNGGDSLAIQAQFGVTTTLDMAARAEWAAERRRRINTPMRLASSASPAREPAIRRTSSKVRSNRGSLRRELGPSARMRGLQEWLELPQRGHEMTTPTRGQRITRHFDRARMMLGEGREEHRSLRLISARFGAAPGP